MSEKKEFEKQTLTVRHERHPSDSYNTPPEIAKWAVERCLQTSARYCGNKKPKELKILEPGCGDTQPFSRHASSLGMKPYATDIRDLTQEPKNKKTKNWVALHGKCDFLNPEHAPQKWEEKFDIIATNPPFKHGIEFIKTSLDMLSPRGVACFLMKVNFLGTQGRAPFFQDRPPSEVHILTKRPSFAHGGTDRGQEYALIMWNGTAVDRKIRKKYGRITRVYWQNNKDWEGK